MKKKEISKKGKETLKKEKSLEVQLLAKRIRQLRIQKGYTNYEFFAYDHKISRSQYGRYETGEDIRYSSLIKLMLVHEMTPAEFFQEGFEDIFKKKK